MTKPKDDSQVYDLSLVGYARVSTEDQSLDMQIADLIRAGVHPDRIFSEKVSGAAARRPKRDLAVKGLREGMTFVVWKLDRVSRSLTDLLQLLENLRERGVNFRSLRDGASLDPSTPYGRMFIAIIGAAAQLERDLIVDRTRAGVKHALANGVKFGQPVKFTEDVIAKAEDMIRSGMSVRQVAKALDFAPATVRLHITKERMQELRAEGPKRET